MTAALPLLLPSGRVLHGWWQKLSPLQPHRVWFAHLFLYRVELLVEVASPAPLAILAQSFLALLARTSPPVVPAQLADALRLPRSLLDELIQSLARTGQVRLAGEVPDAWEVVPTVGGAVASLPPTVLERRTFFFTEGNAPLYLPLALQAATPVPPPDACRFDPAVVAACIAESSEWKTAHGFPDDVVGIVRLPGNVQEADWPRVPLVRMDQALLVLVQMHEGGPLTAFGVRADGWSLAMEPVLSIPGGVKMLCPLVEEAGADAWKPAWQAWCQQRSLPAAEVEACKLQPEGQRLRVQAPARLIERLRAARSDALKGEAWLLAGTGRVRAAARIDLGETA